MDGERIVGWPASRMRHSVICAAALLVLVAAPSKAQPNSGPGGRVYGLEGGGFGDGTFVATGAGAGLRLTRHLSLDLELLHLSGAETFRMGHALVRGGVAGTVTGAIDSPALPIGFDPLSIRDEDQRRDVTTFLTGFSVEFPVADGRLFPYLTGGGVGRVTER